MKTSTLRNALALAGASVLVACADAPPVQPPAAPVVAAKPAVTGFGVEFLETRLSAADSVVDLRYRVLDAEKAAPLLDRKIKPVLVNARSGHRYYVPQVPIIGALRQTTRMQQPVQAGRTYFMLFANPDKELKAGDQLALYVGADHVGDFVLR